VVEDAERRLHHEKRTLWDNRGVSTLVRSDLAPLVQEKRHAFAARNRESARLHDEARRFLPGGHTRTILSHEPFPLTFVRGEGAVLVDADGHEYVDLLGDYTAGLFGHGERRVLDAVDTALRKLASVGGVHPREAELAGLMCDRFGLDRVRFTNSGTEANLMAITAARHLTGRSKVLVFHGGYHGGVLFFSDGVAPWNAPYEFVVAPYNDLAATSALIDKHADGLAAVLVEPMLGSGGCIPAAAEFLRGVFEAAHGVGAVCIADEVMTSRHGRAGLAALLGAKPDIRTFGKYVGGGFSFGAFGGTAELLDQFDGSRAGSIPHAGTFNNNVATMAAGCVVLAELYTADVAEAHTARGERFRADVGELVGRYRLPVSVSGYGSMLTLHALPVPPVDGAGSGRRDPALQDLLFLGLYERGIYTAPRGMVNLSLPVTDAQLEAALSALDDVLSELSSRVG
jgi:glutamate-1-semialdehyde 2,1-aminomutase